jgi:hypothetical protein
MWVNIYACPVLHRCLPKSRIFLLLICFNWNMWSVSLSFLPSVLIFEKVGCQKHTQILLPNWTPVLEHDPSLKSKCQ